MNNGLQMAAGLLPEKPPMQKLKTLAEFERDYIETVICLCHGRIPEAAKILGISPSTLYRKRIHWNTETIQNF